MFVGAEQVDICTGHPLFRGNISHSYHSHVYGCLYFFGCMDFLSNYSGHSQIASIFVIYNNFAHMITGLQTNQGVWTAQAWLVWTRLVLLCKRAWVKLLGSFKIESSLSICHLGFIARTRRLYSTFIHVHASINLQYLVGYCECGFYLGLIFLLNSEFGNEFGSILESQSEL